MKKVSDLLRTYVISFWLMALIMAVYAADNMKASWSMLGVVLVALFFVVMGYKGVQAIGPLKEMEEK